MYSLDFLRMFVDGAYLTSSIKRPLSSPKLKLSAPDTNSMINGKSIELQICVSKPTFNLSPPSVRLKCAKNYACSEGYYDREPVCITLKPRKAFSRPRSQLCTTWTSLPPSLPPPPPGKLRIFILFFDHICSLSVFMKTNY